METTAEKIAVLLSAYNGEKYLPEQLNSILAQKNVALTLYARDDGSSDSTPRILEEAEQRNASVVIDRSHRGNLGIRESFLTLLRNAFRTCPDIGYFAFSDQDDVWLPEKLSEAVKLLSGSDNPVGALYYSNKIFVDSELREIRRESIRYYGDFAEVLWPSLASGCTMVFNRALAERFLGALPDYSCLHDAWVYRTAKCIGADVVFDPNAYILYRQHGNNVCGMETTNLYHSNRYMLSGFFRVMFGKREHVLQRFAAAIAETYPEQIPEENAKLLHTVVTYNRNIVSLFRLLFLRGMGKRDLKTRLIWAYKVLLHMI